MSYARGIRLPILVLILAASFDSDVSPYLFGAPFRQNASTLAAGKPPGQGSDQRPATQTGTDGQTPITNQQQNQGQQNQQQNGQQAAVGISTNAENSLNISVAGDGISSPILVRKCGQSLLVLKNNDNATYVTSLMAVFEGHELRIPDLPGSPVPATVTFQPNSTHVVSFVIPKSWFDSRSWIHLYPGKMQLLIKTAMGSDPKTPEPVIEHSPIDLNVQFAAHSPQSYQAISLILVFFVLLGGAIASLALNTFLPVTLKKLAYKKQLQSLADDTSGVSLRVDSRLRVLLRIERNRLSKLLQSLPKIVSINADVFQELDTGITALRKRVIVAQRINDLRERFDAVSNSSPPSFADPIEKSIQSAADRLRGLYITDKSIDDANTYLDAAEQGLIALGGFDAQARQIAANHQELLKVAAALKLDDLTSMKAVLPGIFRVLEEKYDDSNPVLPSNLIAVDSSIARVHVAIDYSYVRNATTDATILARLNNKQSDLITLLGTLGWRALRKARELVQQMRENIYVEDLIDALKSNNAEIAIDQQAARVYLPLNFRVHFWKPDYNIAQALGDLTCEWTFWGNPDQKLTENGWEVCHFFQFEGVNHVSASVPLQAVSKMTDAAGGTQKDFPILDFSVRGRDRAYSGAAASLFRFSIAFFIALTGLLAGAQDQLAKLDVVPGIIAVFLLGFGADSIKNLLAQAPAQTTNNAQFTTLAQPTGAAQSFVKA